MALGGIVKGKTITLRPPTEADLPTYARLAADLRVRHACGVWHEPAMPATWKERLTEATKDKSTVLWSIDTDGRLIGIARVHFDFPRIASGVSIRYFLIDPDEQGKGHGADAALALHRYIFDYLNMRWSEFEMHADNAAAKRLAERLGYQEYAHGHAVYYVDGRYVDQFGMRMTIETWHERWPNEREYPRLDPALTR